MVSTRSAGPGVRNPIDGLCVAGLARPAGGRYGPMALKTHQLYMASDRPFFYGRHNHLRSVVRAGPFKMGFAPVSHHEQVPRRSGYPLA